MLFSALLFILGGFIIIDIRSFSSFRPWIIFLSVPPISIQQTVSGSNDNTVRVWNLIGKQRNCIVLNGSECSVFNPRTGPQPARQCSISSVRFSYDSLYIVCASTDHTVRVWSIHDGAVVNVLMHHSPVQFAAFSPDNLLIVSATLEKGLAGL